MKQKIIRLTEGDLHNIIKSSVKRYINEKMITGHVPNDGNSMVGGDYGYNIVVGSKNMLDDLLDIIANEREDWEDFANYCEENPSIFDLEAVFEMHYDESTGYGSKSAPIYSLDEIRGEEKMIQYIMDYPDDDIAKFAVATLEKLIGELDDEDFDLEEY